MTIRAGSGMLTPILASRICSAASGCLPTDRRHLLAAGLAKIQI